MAGSFGVQLLKNATTSGNAFDWAGGFGVFSVVATFSGATIKLQFLGADGLTWIDAGVNCTLTASGAGGFYLPPGQIKAVVVSGPPSGVYASAARVNG